MENILELNKSLSEENIRLRYRIAELKSEIKKVDIVKSEVKFFKKKAEVLSLQKQWALNTIKYTVDGLKSETYKSNLVKDLIKRGEFTLYQLGFVDRNSRITEEEQNQKLTIGTCEKLI